MATETGQVPKALANRIAPDEERIFVWNAFWELHTDRPVAMAGVSYLPFSSIDRYAARYGLDDIDEFDRFRSLIRAVDAEFVTWARRKSKTSDKDKG